MHKLLASFFGKHTRVAVADKAAEHWSTWQKQTDAEKPRWTDWGEHPLFLDLIYRELFGSEDCTLFHYLKHNHAAFGGHRALSLCSGDGAFESQLVQHGVFGAMTGLDISGTRVARALAEYGGGNSKLDFIVGDVNQGNYGKGLYDVVFAKAALHHIENLEAAFAGILACLRADGHLVTVDFFGPTRFQWTDAQLDLANEFLNELPPDLRMSSKGILKAAVERSTVDAMIAADPSEAVRSAELYAFIEERFTILEEFDIGGTVFNLVFTPDIICNFQPGNAAHAQLVKKVFTRERELIRTGHLPSDFKFIIARARGSE